MKRLVDFYKDDPLPAILTFVVVAMLMICVIAAVIEGKNFEKFKTENNCKVVEKTESQVSVGYGVMSNGRVGQIITTTPGETAYLCSDGVTYWR